MTFGEVMIPALVFQGLWVSTCLAGNLQTNFHGRFRGFGKVVPVRSSLLDRSNGK